MEKTRLHSITFKLEADSYFYKRLDELKNLYRAINKQGVIESFNDCASYDYQRNWKSAQISRTPVLLYLANKGLEYVLQSEEYRDDLKRYHEIKSNGEMKEIAKIMLLTNGAENNG